MLLAVLFWSRVGPRNNLSSLLWQAMIELAATSAGGEFVNPINVDIFYRPVRIGWCVRSGDFQGYRKALTLTHTLWGGKLNPIIPIDDFELASSLIQAFRVDLLFPISDDPEIEKFIKKFAFLSNPLLSDRMVDVLGNGMKVPRFVDIYHSISRVYEDEYKNCPEPKYQTFIYDWAIDDPLADVFLAKFGKVPSKEEAGLDYYAILANDLKAKTVSLTPQDPVPVYEENLLVLGSFAEVSLKCNNFVRRSYFRGFYFGSSTDYQDLINYWNLQAAGVLVMFYDSAHSERFEASRIKHLVMFNEEQYGQTNQIEILHRNNYPLPDLSKWGNIRRKEFTNSDFFKLILKPDYVFYSKETSLGILTKDMANEMKLTVPLHQNPFADFYDPGQFYVISVHTRMQFLNDSDYTIWFPFVPELNHFYATSCTFEIGRTRLEPDGLGVISEVKRSEISLNLPNIERLIAELFGVYKIDSLLSWPGRVAKQLIKKMGGLQSCRPFKSEGVRKLIAKYSPHDSFDWGEGTGLIYDKGGLKKQFYVNGLEMDANDLFKYLLTKEVFSVGLALDCPACVLQFWISIDNLEKMATCEYCGHHFNIAPYLKQFGNWRFRRSGLFGGYDNQHGAIPVVLTLQIIDQVLGFQNLIYTTSTEFSGKNIPKCETDFIAFSAAKSFDFKTQIVIGECKSNSGEITERDVLNLNAIADRFPSDKFSVYIVFSKLGPFSSAELGHIFHSNQKVHRSIVFTSRELECSMTLGSNLYEELRKELHLGVLHSGSLKELAEVTHDHILLDHSRGYPASAP
ncbi:MAG: hypothetical protein JSS12_03490 [Verrucomicrobia bacterium]|nr:hypothetical protein [Verrucomicrobiota bacterium]